MKKLLWLIEEAFPVIAMILILTVCFLQVICRYCLNNSLSWPEETARMLMICATFIGCGLAAREGKHLEIDCAKHLFGLRVRKWVTTLSAVVTLIFSLIMIYLGTEMVFFIAESGMKAASYPIPMWVFWLALPLGMLLMAFRTVTHYILEMKALAHEENK